MADDELVELVMMDADERIEKAISHTRNEFSSVRTGRATPQLVERLQVEAYESTMHLVELATISVPDFRQLLITPHDAVNVAGIEKAIQASDLGLTPSSDGRSVRLTFPPLTEDRRRDLVRLVNSMAEDGKVSIRAVRRDGRKELEGAKKSGDLSEDALERAEKTLDQLTQTGEADIEKARAAKEEELLEV